MKKRIFAFVLAAALLLGGTASAYSGRFTDVKSGDWFYKAVSYCADNKLISGTSLSTYSPYEDMTRCQFVTILGKLDGVTGSAGAGTFTDVPAGAYYEKYVRWAAGNHIVDGITPTTFAPNDSITREQAATLICRYLEYKNAALPDSAAPAAPFEDAGDISPYAAEGVEAMRLCGLMEGNNGRVLPQKTLNRAEGAALLMRFREGLIAAGVELAPVEEGVTALSVSGSGLVDGKGNAVQLRGVSTHGIAWYPQYVNSACFRQLHEDMGVNVVRLAVYTEEYGGYCSGGDRAALKALIDKGVQAAVENGMYVIIDWHILSDGNPNTHLEEAKAFFGEMAEKYSGCENVLYEICNEPNGGVTWAQIKSYAEKVIPVIRAASPDSVIIVGTPNWSQQVDKAAADPITGYDNIIYALHFYAATHKDELRNTLESALKAGLPVFVSEFGICDASGSGAVDEAQADKWISLLNKYGVSYVEWSLSNKAESASLISASCTKTAGFAEVDLSPSGKWLLRTLTGQNVLPDSPGGEGEQPGLPTAAPTEAICTAKLVNSWGEGANTFYQYELTLTNGSSSPCSEWSAELSFNRPVGLSQGWNGEFSVEGNVLKISSVSYNGALAPGEAAAAGVILSAPAGLAVI